MGWGGTCRNNHSAKHPSTAVETPIPVTVGNKKKRVCWVKRSVLGGIQHAICTSKVYRGARGHGPGAYQVWWKVVACETSEKENSGGHQTRETREGDKNKANY